MNNKNQEKKVVHLYGLFLYSTIYNIPLEIHNNNTILVLIYVYKWSKYLACWSCEEVMETVP